MSEQKKLNETELEKVTGGTADGGFEQAWAEYASTHCSNCGVLGDRGMVCQDEKQLSAAAWAAGQPIRCRAYISPC